MGGIVTQVLNTRIQPDGGGIKVLAGPVTMTNVNVKLLSGSSQY